MELYSILITHFASNEERSATFRNSMDSLIETTRRMPCEIIVVDNGGSIDDSKYLLDLATRGLINTYVRNHLNMHFGYARNQAIKLCNGDYICIADNDIIYSHGWLERCIAVLKAYPDRKIYATPIYNVTHSADKFWTGEVLLAGEFGYRLNRRAGSNCFVIRREDLEEIGGFRAHRVAGTKWTEVAISKGYVAAVCPVLMIKDAGFRKGYNFKEGIPMKMVLSNGIEVLFNDDEYKYQNKGNYISQKMETNG